MARRRSPDLRKTRTREHMIADLAVNHVEREVLLADGTLERIVYDYGLDAIVQIHNADGEQEDGIVYFQIKGSERHERSHDGTVLAFRVSRRDLLHWLPAAMPIILADYDHADQAVYYLYVQRYFESLDGFNLFEAGQTVTVHIPVTQVLNATAVQGIAEALRAVMRQIQGIVRHD